MKLYNPRISTIEFAVSLSRGTIQISMSKTKDPNFKGRPTKGQRIYDRDNSVYFSLQPIECIRILNNLQDLLNGTYINHKEKSEKFKKCLVITHFRENQPSRLIIDRSKDNSGTATGSVVLTILPPQGEGSPVSYVFRHEEMLAMKFYLGHGAKDLDYHKDLYENIEKINYAKRNKSGNSNSYSKQNNNVDYDPPIEGGTTFDDVNGSEHNIEQDTNAQGIDVGW